MFDAADLALIQDEGARRAIRALLNLVEELRAENQSLRADNQRLRDEVARLKGEQGQPAIKPAVKTDLSSEAERRQPRAWRKGAKRDQLTIDRTERLRVERAQLPADAEFKGYQRVVVQDLVLRRDTVCFEKEKWYARSTGSSYLAALPAGYQGQFGPGLRALALVLAYGGHMSEAKILEVVRGAGVRISAGHLSHLLSEQREPFDAEAAAVLEAGLRSSPWQHLDDTETRVNGQPRHCQILCNPLYSAAQTTAQKDRLTIIDVLRGAKSTARVYRRTAEAERVLTGTPGDSPPLRRMLAQLPWEQDLDEATLQELLEQARPPLGIQQQARLREALAIAAYRARTDGPVVKLLVCDDAPQFRAVTEELALCWVHEGRHYKKLSPWVPLHRALLAEFLARFWGYYGQVLAYRQQPSVPERVRLEAAFDTLFATQTGYRLLDERIALTRAKKASLLRVLAHPEIPLHNNPAELGARQRVRQRDVSFGPRSEAGCQAWDTFLTLSATAKKLGVSFSQYVQDRLTQSHQIPPLAQLIAERAPALRLGASWAAPSPSPPTY